MSLADVRDQIIPLRLLRQLLTLQRVPHGLLFWGPSGVGKALVAREFAKALNCKNGEADACDRCLSCQKTMHGNHPDVHVVAPTKKSRIIDVEAIENVIELSSLRPYEGERRIFILNEADRMRGPAQNHLLKTLEEPLGRSVFVLVTEFPQLLLPTIRSRCQKVRFGTLRRETVRDLLVQLREISPEAAETKAALSGGQMSRAFDLIDSQRYEVVLNIVTRLSDGEDPMKVSEEFASYLDTQKSQIETMVKQLGPPVDPKELSKDERDRLKEDQAALIESQHRRAILEHLYLFETWYRDALIYAATGNPERVFNREQISRLEAAGKPLPFEKLSAIEKARTYLERFLSEDRVFRDLFFALAG